MAGGLAVAGVAAYVIADSSTGLPASVRADQDAQRARSLLSSDPKGALIAALGAVGTAPTPRAEEAMAQALESPERLVVRFGQVTTVQISRDDRRLVSLGSDGTARVLTMGTGSVQVIPGREVESTGVDATGERVITADLEGRIRVWDVASGQPPDAIRTLADALSSSRHLHRLQRRWPLHPGDRCRPRLGVARRIGGAAGHPPASATPRPPAFSLGRQRRRRPRWLLTEAPACEPAADASRTSSRRGDRPRACRSWPRPSAGTTSCS